MQFVELNSIKTMQREGLKVFYTTPRGGGLSKEFAMYPGTAHVAHACDAQAFPGDPHASHISYKSKKYCVDTPPTT